MKDDYTTNPYHITFIFLFKRLGECNFMILGMKGLKPVIHPPPIHGSTQPSIHTCIYPSIPISILQHPPLPPPPPPPHTHTHIQLFPSPLSPTLGTTYCRVHGWEWWDLNVIYAYVSRLHTSPLLEECPSRHICWCIPQGAVYRPSCAANHKDHTNGVRGSPFSAGALPYPTASSCKAAYSVRW